jgi:hypothetical protein
LEKLGDDGSLRKGEGGRFDVTPLLNIYRFSHEPIEGVSRTLDYILRRVLYWDVMISIQYFGIQAAAAAVAIVFNQNPTPRATRKFMAENKKCCCQLSLSCLD